MREQPLDEVDTVILAVTRELSASLNRCELSYVSRSAINLPLAREQHAVYEACLAGLGAELIRLSELRDCPDAVFVEDTAIVLDEAAVITRPGAATRRAEIPSVADALSRYRELLHIDAPGTLDGGDVLQVDRTIFVGATGRTNREGFESLTVAVEPLGYKTRAVPVRGCLHLKSAVTQVAPDTLLINREWVDSELFPEFKLIDIDPQEPHAANALLLNETVVFPAEFPATASRLAAAGIEMETPAMSELAKAEGAVTCCSLIVNA